VLQWEYRFVSAEAIGVDWRPRYLNGAELPDWDRGPTLFEYAERCGREGWELVAAQVSGTEMSAYRLVFKRPIQPKR
jgi:hypothetical protein